MNSEFGFIDIILIAMFAGFIILRLRNVLGRKTGHQGKSMSRHFPRGVEVLKDIENNEAIKSGNIDEEAKKNFLKGAEIAYEQIITSFSKGDKRALKKLLAKSMYNQFAEVIDERASKKIINETTFIGLKSSKIIEFNKIIEGNPDEIKTVNDVWKFSKNMWSQDPTWYLVETSNN